MRNFISCIAFILSVNVCFVTIAGHKLPTEAITGQFPFHVVLLNPLMPDQIRCSAALISNSLILTTSDCVEGLSKIQALFGIAVYPPPEDSQVQTRTYDQDDIVRNPLSPGGGLVLLRTNETLEIDNNVHPIRLAQRHIFSEAYDISPFMTFWAGSALNYVHLWRCDYQRDEYPYTFESFSPQLPYDCRAGLVVYRDDSNIRRLAGVYTTMEHSAEDWMRIVPRLMTLEPYLDWLVLQVAW